MDKSGIMEAKSPFVECSGFLLKDSVAPWRVPGCLEPTFSSRCSTAATAKGRMKKAKQSEERRKERKKERKKERRKENHRERRKKDEDRRGDKHWNLPSSYHLHLAELWGRGMIVANRQKHLRLSNPEAKWRWRPLASRMRAKSRRRGFALILILLRNSAISVMRFRDLCPSAYPSFF